MGRQGEREGQIKYVAVSFFIVDGTCNERTIKMINSTESVAQAFIGDHPKRSFTSSHVHSHHQSREGVLEERSRESKRGSSIAPINTYLPANRYKTRAISCNVTLSSSITAITPMSCLFMRTVICLLWLLLVSSWLTFSYFFPGK